jgi:hypothetical protein
VVIATLIHTSSLRGPGDGLDGLGVGDIGGQDQRVGAGRARLAGGGLETVAVAGHEGQGHAGGGEAARRRAADAARRAGDENDLGHAPARPSRFLRGREPVRRATPVNGGG